MEQKSDIAFIIGQRLRTKRIQLGYSQELTAEEANLHPTYIGQVERGEKNLTITSLEKICRGLNYPMDELFANIVSAETHNKIAQECYDMIANQPLHKQKQLCALLKNIMTYSND